MQRLRVALIAAVCVALAGAAVVAARRPAPHAVRLLFTGDILLSRQVEVEHRRTGGSPWDSLAPLFAQADWVGGNLEGAIGADSACAASSSAPCFAFAADVAGRLAAAGFTALAVENNHAADLGPAGRANTARALAAAGVMPVGFDDSPRFVRIGELTVAVVAITTIPGADGRAQTIPSLEIAQRLRLARALANVVVVSIHWGTELQDWPNAAQRSAAAWLVDHGADIVVGHHPHVVQKPECVHGHPVFFSLGNHVFDQKYPQTKNGLIADCVVTQGRLRCDGLRTHARHGSAVPVPSGASHEAALAACTPPVHPSLVVSGWTIRPVAWSAAAAADSSGVVLEGWRDGAFRWRTRRVSLVSLAAGVTADDGQPLLLALERHPSPMDGEVAVRPHVYAVGDRGLVAKWRGTALAWPLLDAVVDANGGVCALHRGDSFLRLDRTVTATRTMRYRWNGFGFSAASDPANMCARTTAQAAWPESR
jgi:hypothetical protein